MWSNLAHYFITVCGVNQGEIIQRQTAITDFKLIIPRHAGLNYLIEYTNVQSLNGLGYNMFPGQAPSGHWSA